MPKLGSVVVLSWLTGLVNAAVWCLASLGWAGETRGDRHSQLPADGAPAPIVQSLVGQCRRTGRLERIYDAANLAANGLGDLAPGVTIALAGEVNQPSFGWIRLSAPLNGYIQTPFLQGCDDGTAPSLDCGIVIQPELALKPSASTLSEPIGMLRFEQGFNITGAPQMQRDPPAQMGRIWVPIDRFGTVGWVTETSPDGYGNNFRRVPCESIGLEPVG